MKTKIKNSQINADVTATDSSNKPVSATAEVMNGKSLKGYVLDEVQKDVVQFNSISELVNALSEWDLKLVITGKEKAHKI